MSASKPKVKLLVLLLGMGAAVTALIMGVSRSSSDRALGATSVDKPVSRSELVPRDRVFISGSMVNLREAASTTATVLKQVPMGTECAVEEKAGSGWWRIGCGDSYGWTKSELLSPERPTLEPLLARAQDAMGPLKERFDAALRATALQPEHAEARKLLWSLFAEQERVQLETFLAKEPGRLPLLHASVACTGESTTETCLKQALWVRHQTWHHLELYPRAPPERSVFVSAALKVPLDEKKPPQLWVRTGTVEGDPAALDLQVHAQSRYAPSDTLKNALEKLLESPPSSHSSRLSRRVAVFTPEALETISQVEGSWTRLTRKARAFVIQEHCNAHTPSISIEMNGDQPRFRVNIGQDEGSYDVAGFQNGRDGSLTLMGWDGTTLKRSRSRDDPRLSTWAFSEYEGINGLFVPEELRSDFPVNTPDCKGFYGEDDSGERYFNH